jgi:predicted SprT family Zn-dependent metalloprotease
MVPDCPDSQKTATPRPDLATVFAELNAAHFDAFMDAPVLRWNGRLRSAAGRFRAGSRSFWRERPPVIEIATYLLEEEKSSELVRDTMAHEMIHYWLWVRKKPYGHTPEFLTKMKAMGAPRYNPVPRISPLRYVYRCACCAKEIRVRKKLASHACMRCCKTHAGGRYDSRFKLIFERRIEQSPERATKTGSETGPKTGKDSP